MFPAQGLPSSCKLRPLQLVCRSPALPFISAVPALDFLRWLKAISLVCGQKIRSAVPLQWEALGKRGTGFGKSPQSFPLLTAHPALMWGGPHRGQVLAYRHAHPRPQAQCLAILPQPKLGFMILTASQAAQAIGMGGASILQRAQGQGMGWKGHFPPTCLLGLPLSLAPICCLLLSLQSRAPVPSSSRLLLTSCQRPGVTGICTLNSACECVCVCPHPDCACLGRTSDLVRGSLPGLLS